MRHGVSGQGSLEVSVSGWDNDIYHVRIVEVETVVVLAKVTLGSAYYADLLSDFGGNRLFAIASYNAGPGRIKKWRQGIASAPAWVEAIPFRRLAPMCRR